MHTFRDAMIVFRDEASAALRNRIGIAIGLIQPCVYLLLFGPLLVKALPDGESNAWQFYIPGLLVQLGLFATGYAGFNLIPDMRSGYLERLRVTPASRLALLLGRVLRDLLILLVQLVAIVLIGLLFGLRAPLPGVLAALALMLILGISLASLSYTLAIKLPTEYLFAPVLNGVALPLMLLSGILLPLTFAPGWLHALTNANPLRYAVDAMRDLFDGHYTSQPVLLGVAVVIAFAVASLGCSTRIFGRYNS
ncbi:ABC transporter permease (plasmid) [Streptomyces sp. NBC_00390]|uniref:ABC transporter permease n=1 Tax=Streptomyces sp. NBC_00390 TaxID=2975736 RepID=UPI002E2043E9